MKDKHLIPDRAAVFGGLLLLLILGLTALISRQDFSAWERRNLTQLPTSVSLTDWKLNDDLEEELSDQLPGRRLFVNLYAQAQVLTGRAVQLEAWPLSGAILEKPVTGNPAAAARRVSQFRTLCGELPFFILTPPTPGMLMKDRMDPLRRAVYEDEEALYLTVTNDEAFVPLYAAFQAEQARTALYYRTDHHWTLEGAYLAYRQFCQAAGLEPAPLTAFTVTEEAPFYGTTYARSGLPFAQADTLVCAEPAAPVSLSVPEAGLEADHLIFPEEAQTYDGYAVYLKGNHGLMTIESPAAETDRTLVVFKDSFANCLLPFLTRHYARIIAADARYLDITFPLVLQNAQPADRVLFLYSLDSLLNDTSLTRKLR